MKNTKKNHVILGGTLLLLATVIFLLPGYLFPIPYLYTANWATYREFYPLLYIPVFLVVKFGGPAALSFVFGIMFQNVRWSLVYAFIIFLISSFISLLFLNFSELVLLCFLGLTVFYVVYFRLALSAFFSHLNLRPSLLFKYCWFLVMVGGFVLRINYLWFGENMTEPDAHCRMFISQIWADYYVPMGSIGDILMPMVEWPPLHFYISGLVYSITGSIKAVQVLHATVGLFSVFMLYQVARVAFYDEYVARISAAAFMVYPVAAYEATLVMSETWFVCLFLSSIYFLLSYVRSKHTKYMVASGLFLALAGAFRFEAWPLPVIFGMVLYFLWKERRISTYLILAVSLVPALLFMVGTYEKGFHPFRWLIYSDIQVRHQFEYFIKNYYGSYVQLFYDRFKWAWIPGGLVVFMGCFFMYRPNVLGRGLWWITLLFLLPFAYKLISLTLFPESRYLAMYEVMLIPFMAMCMCAWFRKFKYGMLVTLFFVAGISFSGIHVHGIHSPRRSMSFSETVNVVQKLPKANLILDFHGSVATYEFLAESRIPIILPYIDPYLKDFLNLQLLLDYEKSELFNGQAVRFLVTEENRAYDNTNFDRMEQIMRSYSDLYVVSFPDGPLSKYFNFTGVPLSKDGHKLMPIYFKDGYAVYKVLAVEGED